LAGRCGHDASVAIDGDGLVVQAQSDVVALEKVLGDQRQVRRALAAEKTRELHAIVGGARFLAQHRDLEGWSRVGEPLKQALPDHTVTDDDQLFR
jgi:hypothetical protein